jgi:hypothetical protein
MGGAVHGLSGWQAGFAAEQRQLQYAWHNKHCTLWQLTSPD